MAQNLQAEIERFLKDCRRPALLEPGEELLALHAGNHELTVRGSRLTLQAWDDGRNFVRRIVAIKASRAGCLELEVERFGKLTGTLQLLDLERPTTLAATRRGARQVFREQFRLYLTRQFPDFSVSELSAEPNLEHSLSPAYPRALLTRGQSGMAAIAASREADCDGVLTFGLIWLDYLRRRERRLTIESLAIFVPAESARATALRLLHLSGKFRLFTFDRHDFVTEADPRDAGNLDTRLEPCRTARGDAPHLDKLRAIEGVQQVELQDGNLSLRMKGIEFARTAGAEVLFGFQLDRSVKRASLQAHNVEEAARLARDLSAMRDNPASPLHRRVPEAWLEGVVREQLQVIDATLSAGVVYGQVPAFAGGERGVLDLLAVDYTGRLAVIELKASQDIHLPLQALDYWMRVRWHLTRGDFTRHGYFPGTELRPGPPRLLLVSPALDFHPTTETLLSFFAPEIEVERIGIGTKWRTKLQVLFRAQGATSPD